MRGIVLACGINVAAVPGLAQATIVPVSRRPGKSDVDAALARARVEGAGPGADVIVAGDDADLAAVVLRLLRRDRIATISIGYLPARGSAVAQLWGLPTEPGPAYELASTGPVRPVPLIRDDAGGVLVGLGTFPQVDGIGYCDDELVLRGTAQRIEVQPDNSGGPGVLVRVQQGRLRKRVTAFGGRAFQLGCDPVTPTLDGVRRDRMVERWTWYRHTEDLRLVR